MNNNAFGLNLDFNFPVHSYIVDGASLGYNKKDHE